MMFSDEYGAMMLPDALVFWEGKLPPVETPVEGVAEQSRSRIVAEYALRSANLYDYSMGYTLFVSLGNPAELAAECIRRWELAVGLQPGEGYIA